MKRSLLAGLALLPVLLAAGCSADEAEAVSEPAADIAVPAYETIGTITRSDPRADAILPEGAVIEKLTANDFRWSEGPVWIREGGYLLFSDVPQNTIYKWAEGEGVSVWMQPAGYDGPATEDFREPGTNGLIPAGQPGAILIADHGNRMVASLDLETQEKTPLATEYEGMKFSSPNDLVLAANGALYFTDPPYGLAGIDDSPLRETPFNGVYRLAEGTVALVDDALSKPNGVILSPDQSTLYVAQSDPAAAKIFRYALGADGLPTERTEFADMTAQVAEGLPGLPDGMAIDTDGNLYATGPGGVHVFAPDGTELALISTGSAAANCTFGDDGSTLYITSGAFLARVRLSATGYGF